MELKNSHTVKIIDDDGKHYTLRIICWHDGVKARIIQKVRYFGQCLQHTCNRCGKNIQRNINASEKHWERK